LTLKDHLIDPIKQKKEKSGDHLPERTIEATGKLGRVGHQTDLVCNTFLHQGILNGLDTAVHHITRGDHLATSASIGHRDICQTLDRSSVVDRAILTQDTAMAVRGIGAEADIAGKKQVGERLAQDLESTDRGGVGIVRCRSHGIL